MVWGLLLLPIQHNSVLGMADPSPSQWPKGFWAIPPPATQWPGHSSGRGKSFLACSFKIPQKCLKNI